MPARRSTMQIIKIWSICLHGKYCAVHQQGFAGSWVLCYDDIVCNDEDNAISPRVHRYIIYLYIYRFQRAGPRLYYVGKLFQH